MLTNKTFLAIIPARVGSKRLPGKNLNPFNGKALINWTVDAALKSKYIDQIVVSSDSDDILNLVQNSEKILKHKRSPELSTDGSKSIDVVKHIIKHVVNSQFDNVILLQPTSPLRNDTHIDEAICLMNELDAKGIVSVTGVDHSPLWSNTLPEDLCMVDFIKKGSDKRSQDLPEYYRLNGAIYISQITELMKNTGFIYRETYAYKMDKFASVDIDDEFDFMMAQIIMSQNYKQ